VWGNMVPKDTFKSVCGLDCCLVEADSPKCTPPVCTLYLWCPDILLTQPQYEQITSPIVIMDFRLTPCSVAVGRNNAFSGRGGFVGMVPRVWDGCLRNQGLILTKGGRFFLSTEHGLSLRLSEPPVQLVMQAVSLTVKQPGHVVDHCFHLLSRLRMQGPIPLLPCMH